MIQALFAVVLRVEDRRLESFSPSRAKKNGVEVIFYFSGVLNVFRLKVDAFCVRAICFLSGK